MSKICKECGHLMDDNAQSCPNCGCPAENASASAFMDADVLNEGKSTEAESTIKDYAESILKWGNILAIIIFVMCIISGLFAGITVMANGGSTGMYVGIGIIAFYVLMSFIAYVITKFIVKLVWAVITLFVNISTTLKRIEILLDKNGTN